MQQTITNIINDLRSLQNSFKTIIYFCGACAAINLALSVAQSLKAKTYLEPVGIYLSKVEEESISEKEDKEVKICFNDLAEYEKDATKFVGIIQCRMNINENISEDQALEIFKPYLQAKSEGHNVAQVDIVKLSIENTAMGKVYVVVAYAYKE